MAYYKNSLIYLLALICSVEIWAEVDSLGWGLSLCVCPSIYMQRDLKAPGVSRPGLQPLDTASLCSVTVNSKFIFLASSNPHAWLFSQNMESDMLMF